MTLVEIVISMAVLVTVALASAGAFSSSIAATERARRMTEGAAFLETTMESVSAQAFDNLLSLDGEQIFDQDDADGAEFAVTLSVFVAEVDLVQVDALLSDLDSGNVLGRLSTWRARR